MMATVGMNSSYSSGQRVEVLLASEIEVRLSPQPDDCEGRS
jgi:hypothetical protein